MTAVLSGQPAVDTTKDGQSYAVTLRGVSKRYGGGPLGLALDRIELAVPTGQFLCIVGASGCGKSTLLNLVSGLDTPSAGEIGVASRPTLMFQEHALLPWLSALDNVALPLRLAGVGKVEREDKAADYLRTVHLGDVLHKRPHELSGGMRQRVAIARTLATESKVLLMDEPFGALDAMTRDLLHDGFESIWQARRLTILFVTHNVREAVRLGDRVVLLSSRPGRVVADFPVNLPRPRSFSDPAVTAASGEITAALRKEVARHAQH